MHHTHTYIYMRSYDIRKCIYCASFHVHAQCGRRRFQWGLSPKNIMVYVYATLFVIIILIATAYITIVIKHYSPLLTITNHVYYKFI